MKISWGYIITFVYVVFAGGIIFLAVKANNQTTDMVTPAYYDEELKYQQVLDQSALTARLSAPVSVEINKEELTLHFPEEFRNKKITGEFYLYCPSDEKKDFKIKFESNSMMIIQHLPVGISGLFELKLKWESENKKYYYEKKLIF